MVNELVQCTPNHHHCGGAGGCSGATAELAFQFVKACGLGILKDLGFYRTGNRSSSLETEQFG